MKIKTPIMQLAVADNKTAPAATSLIFFIMELYSTEIKSHTLSKHVFNISKTNTIEQQLMTNTHSVLFICKK